MSLDLRLLHGGSRNGLRLVENDENPTRLVEIDENPTRLELVSLSKWYHIRRVGFGDDEPYASGAGITFQVVSHQTRRV